MMSLARLAAHCYPSLAVIPPACSLSFFANGFPEEGSTWISQTICGKLQENWQQILGERTEGGRRVQARMCARVREEENEVESYKDPQGVLFSGALTVVPQGSPLSK